MKRSTLLAAFLLAAMLCPSFAAAPPADSMDSFVQQRRELTHRKRRIILNNDGCDCLYFPKAQEPTAENFLALRTSPLADSQVDTVFYCTISSGFGNFTHHTRVGHVLVRQVGDELNLSGRTNLTQALIDQGTDPLRLVTQWCHAQGKECFWSMRMNDTHDAAHRPDKPYPLFPPLKAEHPEFLVGSRDRIPRYGPWSSVDYGRAEIRDLAFRYIEEVCRNYDVDGIELDFCRHLCYFPSVAFGGEASDDERSLMTELMQRIRTMTEAEGQRRGRPILIAIRVPDCREYSRAVGLDWESWLGADLVDLLIGGFYLQLNPWEYLVEAGRRHGVAVYAGLSESRVRGDAPPFGRNSPESYRGRAMRAWQAGVDGIYLFNYFNPQGGFLREIGEPESLRKLDKIYYATIRNRNPNSYLADGVRFLNVPVLTPQNGVSVPVGQTHSVDLRIGDESAGGTLTDLEVTLHLQKSGPADFQVQFNGTPLANPARSDVWTQYQVPPALLRPGSNQVALTALPSNEPEPADAWNVCYEGNEMPTSPWSSDRLKENLECEVEDGALRIADRGTESGDYFYWSYPWNADPDREAVVEASVKVVSGWNNIIVCNGRAYERVALYPDRIGLHEARLTHPMDTTAGFRTYRVVLKGNDIQVFVDGQLCLDGRGKFTTPLPGRNDIRFGAANSPSTGEAYWKNVKLRYAAGQITLNDLVLSVRH